MAKNVGLPPPVVPSASTRVEQPKGTPVGEAQAIEKIEPPRLEDMDGMLRMPDSPSNLNAPPGTHVPTRQDFVQRDYQTVSRVPAQQISTVRSRLEALVGDKAKLESVVGEGWTLRRLPHAFVAGPDGQPALGSDGLAIAKEGRDTYYDVETKSGRSGAIVRERAADPERFHFNIKPAATGPLPAARTEYPLDVSKELSPELLKRFLEVTPSPAELLREMTVTRHRYAYALENPALKQAAMLDLDVATYVMKDGSAETQRAELGLDGAPELRKPLAAYLGL